MTVVRPARRNDVARIVEMAARFVASTGYGVFGGAGGEQLADFARLLLERDDATILVAEQDGALVGFLALLALPHPIFGGVWLDEVAWWVDPEHRRGRIGITLLQAAEAWAVIKNCTVLKLASPAGSSVGRYLARRGYTRVEEVWLKRT